MSPLIFRCPLSKTLLWVYQSTNGFCSGVSKFLCHTRFTFDLQALKEWEAEQAQEMNELHESQQAELRSLHKQLVLKELHVMLHDCMRRRTDTPQAPHFTVRLSVSNAITCIFKHKKKPRHSGRNKHFYHWFETKCSTNQLTRDNQNSSGKSSWGAFGMRYSSNMRDL